MSPGEYAIMGVLIVFGAVALCALALGGYSFLRLARGTRLAWVSLLPRIVFTSEAKEALPSLRMWAGLFFTSVALSFIVSLGITAATTPSAQLKEFNTYFYHPDGAAVLLGVSRGVAQCEADAAVYARAHDLFESAWSHECCAVGDSACGP